jgi:hypothetical protein
MDAMDLPRPERGSGLVEVKFHEVLSDSKGITAMLPAQHAKIASGRGEQMLKAEQLIRACMGGAFGGIEGPLE